VLAHSARVWRVLRRLGLQPSDADDATQEVFCVMANRLADVTPKTVGSFLIGIALRVARDHKKSKWVRDGRLEDDMDCLHSPDDPERLLADKEAIEALDALLGELDHDAREVFTLSEIEELPRPQIASILGVAEGTIASRLARARQQFDAALARRQATIRRLES
jgi:RNA polymerase sigma-70 factor (ECF subfamily)